MEAVMLGVSDWTAVLLDPIHDPLEVPDIPTSVHITLQYWTQMFRGINAGHQDTPMSPFLLALFPSTSQTYT